MTPLMSPQHRRTQSMPTAPSISVEDTSTNEPLQEVRTENQLEDSNGSCDKDHYSRRPSHLHRKKSPGLEWHDKWTKDRWCSGRVLLIDYVSREHAPDGRRKIIAQEFHDIDGLRKFYSNPNYSQQSAMRVIHVQNASWATRFLLHKFNITNQDDLIGTAFARWARFEKPQQRAGKPVLNGKTFPQRRDPWRGIVRAAFGLDYLKHYQAHAYNRGEADERVKMMELNKYDSNDNPVYGYDVFVQRLSVYIQKSEGMPFVPTDQDIVNPYNEAEYTEYMRARKEQHRHSRNGEIPTPGHEKEEYIPKLPTLDNGNTIIVFEHCHSGDVTDTLIGARQEIESRWRRLTFYLKREETLTDERLALECMDLILKDIFKALTTSWDRYLRACETHVSILEDKIYDNPADESRAPELWTNSSLWLKVEKLMYLHLDIAKELRTLIKDVMEDDGQDEWLSGAPEDFEKLANSIQEDLIKPTSALNDMMYKSVEIRDSRQSLQLGTSMWRLSWITFIFLPLTFIVGFFGMNVDTFSGGEDLPSIKWYFISAVPLMVLVFLFWYLFKHGISARLPGRGYDNPAPLQRGVYEHLFHEWSDRYPGIWSRVGPREEEIVKQGIRPGVFNRWKWRIMAHWFKPERTIRVRGYDPHEELSFWGQVKRNLARRWLSEIALVKNAGPGGAPNGPYEQEPEPDLEAGLGHELGSLTQDNQRESAIQELLSHATPVALADADPSAARRMAQLMRSRSNSSNRSSSGGRGSPRPGSPGSEVMVEEKEDDAGSPDPEGSRQGRAALARSRSSEERARLRRAESVRSAREAMGLGIGVDRLSVPIMPGRAGEHAP